MPATAPATRPPVDPLPLTGERTVPGIEVENYWYQRHVAAYRWAATRCAGRQVVDSGAGQGYGTAMLAQVADTALGVELVPAVVEHARLAHPGTAYAVADVCDTGLPAAATDVVVNLQVIEHLPDVPRFLREQRRILRPGGDLVVATPNRLTFTPHDHDHDPADGPVNIFHVEEFTADELVDRLTAVGGFVVDRVLGLHHGPRIRAVEAAVGRPLVDLVLTDPAAWPPWLRHVVRRTTPTDFEWRVDDVDTSLDLLVLAHRPAA